MRAAHPERCALLSSAGLSATARGARLEAAPSRNSSSAANSVRAASRALRSRCECAWSVRRERRHEGRQRSVAPRVRRGGGCPPWRRARQTRNHLTVVASSKMALKRAKRATARRLEARWEARKAPSSAPFTKVRSGSMSSRRKPPLQQQRLRLVCLDLPLWQEEGSLPCGLHSRTISAKQVRETQGPLRRAESRACQAAAVATSRHDGTAGARLGRHGILDTFGGKEAILQSCIVFAFPSSAQELPRLGLAAWLQPSTPRSCLPPSGTWCLPNFTSLCAAQLHDAQLQCDAQGGVVSAVCMAQLRRARVCPAPSLRGCLRATALSSAWG